MPYKVVLQGDHGGVLDDITVKTDDGLKQALHDAIDEWELTSGDRITILSMSAVDVENETFWNNILEDMRRRG
jgi:hypothetical protein